MFFLADFGNNTYLCTQTAVKTAAKLQVFIKIAKKFRKFIPYLL